MQRLRGRGTEEEADVARRLRSALDELQAAPEFDHVVVNDDLGRCLREIEAIVAGRGTGSVPKENIEVFRAGVARVLDEDFANISG